MALKRKFSGASGKGKEPSAKTIAAFVAAAAKGNKDAVKKFYLKYPDHVDAADKTGRTALQAAAEHNQVDVGNVLLFAKADPNKPAQDGLSPFLTWTMTLRTAETRKNDYRFLESLLMAGANVNARQEGSGMSALMFYAVFHDEKLCDYLLKKGADPTLKDNRGKTARDHANEMSDHFAMDASYSEGDSSYVDLKAAIDKNILKLEKAEKEWPQRPRAAKVLSRELADRLKLLPS
ncbi:MAG: ankyrin repeat domain-containing protein [Alphaproteobacteria bacterium]|nr:ankyrin repeat domain-containing protein [Alphaproteobacteria bacterium]